MQEELMIPMTKPSQVIVKSFVGTEYNLYLNGEISHNADNYLEHYAVYHQAGPEDIIRLWVSSPGGSVAVGVQYIEHMRQSAAKIIGVVGMECASQATAIMLACSDWELNEMSTFLVHGFSYGAYGHEAQVFNQATFNKKLNERYMRSTYTGFLDEDSIQEALKGVDLLFEADELWERLQAFKEYRESQPCLCGDPECPRSPENMGMVEYDEDGDEIPQESSNTLEDIIKKAVREVLEKELPKILLGLEDSEEVSMEFQDEDVSEYENLSPAMQNIEESFAALESVGASLDNIPKRKPKKSS